MTYGTPTAPGDGFYEYRATVRNASFPAFAGTITFQFLPFAEPGQPIATFDEAAMDDAFQEFVDLMDSAASFEIVAAEHFSPAKLVTLAQDVTPTPEV